MNKKMIRNTLLLLIIPLLISLVISVVNIRKNSFTTSVNYDKNAYVESYYDAPEEDINPVETYSKNYTFIVISAIVLLIVFGIFYIYLSSKKGW